jgi:hypothetical protein
LSCSLLIRGDLRRIQAEKPLILLSRFFRPALRTRAIIDAIIKVHNVIVEVKVVEALSKVHYSQVRSYLRATGLSVALLVKFDHPKADDGSSPLHPQSSPRSPNLLTSLQIWAKQISESAPSLAHDLRRLPCVCGKGVTDAFLPNYAA